jgi:hypothetical protein
MHRPRALMWTIPAACDVRTQRLLFVLTASLALSVACGRADDRSRAQYSAPDERRKERSQMAPAVPFVEAAPPPSRPPALELRAGDAVAEALLYQADWITKLEAVRLEPSTPVTWPRALALPTDPAPTLVFGTSVPPDRIVLHAFGRVDPATGEPQGEPVFATELTKLGQRRYRFSVAGDRTLVGELPEPTFRAGYLAVFCTWYVPVDLRSPGDGSPEVTASWLLQVEP